MSEPVGKHFVSVQDALAWGNTLKSRYGDGIATIVVIMNDSQQALRYRNAMDWSGHRGQESEAPRNIGPAQAGVFLHVHTSGAARGSVGAIQYDWGDSTIVVAWCAPFTGSNSCCIEDRSRDLSWDEVYDRLSSATGSKYLSRSNGNLYGTISSASSPIATFYIR